MPFLTRPTRTPIAPPRSTTPVLSKATEKQEKTQTVERPSTPIPQTHVNNINIPTTHTAHAQDGGALVQTAPQYGRYDDAGFGYGYGSYGSYGFGYNQAYGQQQQSYAMGVNPFVVDTVTPSNYYACEFNNNYNNNYNYNGTYGGYGGASAPAPWETVANMGSSLPQYQSMYSMPSYYGAGAHMAYMNNSYGQNTMDTMSLRMGSTIERASTTVFSTPSFFEPTMSRSQSQPMLRRPVSPPLSARLPAQASTFASLAPWEMIGNTMMSQDVSVMDNSYTPWGSAMTSQNSSYAINTPRAQTPPPSMAAPTLWAGYTEAPSTTSWTNQSVKTARTVGNELRRGFNILSNKVQTELTAAFQPHPTRQPMMKQNNWDGSRTRNYEYRPVDRAFFENGMPVAQVQYTGDGTSFNLTMDGVRLGAVMRRDPAGLKNPFSLGPRRGDNWIVVDKNAQTRYTIQRKAKSYYELHVQIGAHTHAPTLSQHLYSCNWYQALVQGHCSVLDQNGAVVATCVIGPDTGSQSDRAMSIQVAGGTDHPTLISTIMIALELARTYCNDAIHPSNQSNKGKATMGFGPSVVPNLFFA